MSSARPAAAPEVAVAVDLYRLPPSGFTAARNARAKELRAAGDRPLAALVAGMPRPSVAAWAVNLLVRERPDDVQALLGTGALLLAAQAAMDGAALRDLNRRRHAQMAALRTEADSLAAALDQRLSDTVWTAVDGTLRAAMADPGAAAAIRTGLLTRELVSTGFDPVDVDDAVAVAGAPPLLAPPAGTPAPVAQPAPTPDDVRVTLAPRRTAAPTGGRGPTAQHEPLPAQRAAERERRAAHAELADARERSTRATAAREAADAAVAGAARRRAELAEEIGRLAARLEDLRAQDDAAAAEQERAERDRDAAASAAEVALGAERAAQERVDRLTGPSAP